MDASLAWHILQRVVAAHLQQAASPEPIESVSAVALDVLAETMRSYIVHISTLAKHSAEHSGRTLVTMLDLQWALHHLHLSPADLSSFTITHVQNISLDTLEVIQSTEIQDTTVPEDLKAYMPQDAPEPLPPFCPAHMPSLPARHAYKRTPVYQYREQDPGRVRELSTMQNRRLQENLKQLVRKTSHTLVELFDVGTTTGQSIANGHPQPQHEFKQLPVINYEAPRTR